MGLTGMLDLAGELQEHGLVFGPVSATVDYSGARQLEMGEVMYSYGDVVRPIFEHSCAVPVGRRQSSAVYFRPKLTMSQYEALDLIGRAGLRLAIPVENQAYWRQIHGGIRRDMLNMALAAEQKGPPCLKVKNLMSKVVGSNGAMVPVLVMGVDVQQMWLIEPNLGQPMPLNCVLAVTMQG